MNKKEKELVKVIKELIEDVDCALGGYSNSDWSFLGQNANQEDDWILLKSKLEELFNVR